MNDHHPTKNVMPELPSDILLSHMLPRLPAISLHRFKLVCKQWRSVISEPEFARIHLNHLTPVEDDHSDQNHKLLLLSCTFYGKTFNLDTLDFASENSYTKTNLPLRSPVDVWMFASLHGLVCAGIDSPSSERCFYKNLVLWNPSTGIYKKLSNSNSFGLYFRSGDGFGLFYDSLDDDYQLLHVVSKSGRAYIYSLKSDSWRKVESIPSTVPRRFGCFLSRGSSANGNLYFMVKDRIGMLCSSVISFDLKIEKFKVLPSPPTRIGKRTFQSLSLLRGCICVCNVYDNGMKKEIELFRLDENERTVWVKAANSFIPNVGLVLEPLYMMKNGNLLMLDCCKALVFKFDPEKEDIEDDDRYLLSYKKEAILFQTMIYTETLISPNLSFIVEKKPTKTI